MAFTREDVRLETYLEGEITSHYDENGVLLPEMLNLPAVISNISATGMSIECEREFEQKESFCINVELGGKEMRFVPVIMRKEKIEGEKFRYGCKFIHLDEKEEEAIRKYIFEVQLEIRRKRRYQEQLEEERKKHPEQNNNEEQNSNNEEGK